MVVHGVMAVSSFPNWKESFLKLASLCDKVHVRMDVANGDASIMKELDEYRLANPDKFGNCVASTGWSVPDWRQDCLDLCGPCDIVLCPDQDEIFEDSMSEELKDFYKSDKRAMMFSYNPMVTDDGRQVNGGVPYPPDPHCKAYKWQKEMSYFPYHGDGKIAQYIKPDMWWWAKTKINHYCCYTKAMEQAKRFRSDTPKGRGNKAVTLIGFGPSSDKAVIRGEVWSLNNCDEVFNKDTMMRVTRIFQMHQPEKVLWKPCIDKRTHLEHLDYCGKMGHRIIMQEACPQIYGSEAYPLLDVKSKLGYGIFCGTPSYLVAMAILEGYTEINVYGFDQSDWEHTIQRDNFATWCTYAMGRGIKVQGCVTWMERHTKMYGYDYGPEWDDYQNKLLWWGHPMEIKYKIPSRAGEGQFFKKGGR